MADYVIGLDFGNCNSIPCFIEDFNSETKLGGDVHRLIPPDLLYGIPSVYFYSKRKGTFLGFEAMTARATPRCNRLRYLKRNLGKTVTIEDKTIDINDAITEVIQYCVRVANEQLLKEFGETTNLISLTYPAAYNSAQRKQLIELAEAGTLEDGTPIQVVGTIAGASAAALDYLAVQKKTERDTTVLVYDLGACTFGLSLVAAYPNGRQDDAERLYYYDILCERGLQNLGGVDFDNAMFEILKVKVKEDLEEDYLTRREDERLREIESEISKAELSEFDISYPEIVHDDECLDISVTRAEFEAATEHLLMKTIDLTKEIIADNPDNKPEYIVLTGGSSEMPMVENALKKHLPEYADKIVKHNPIIANASGAARYGKSELEGGHAVRKTLPYDIGVRLWDMEKNKPLIDTYATAGTALPYQSEWHTSETYITCFILFRIYEATVSSPDPFNVDGNYVEIMEATVRFTPPNTKMKSRIIIDKNGLLTFECFPKLTRGLSIKLELKI